MSFGERLREARNKAGLSQEDLSFELELTQGAIGHYETSKTEPNLERLVKLSKVLNVSLDWLLEVDESQTDIHSQNSRLIQRKKLSGMALINKLSGEIEKERLSEQQMALLSAMIDEFVK